jgi:hypothetical protein
MPELLIALFGVVVYAGLQPTSVDSPPGSATLNGHITFPTGTNVSYYYEYSLNCSSTGRLTTAVQSIIADGQQQILAPLVVNGLSPGDYCYRKYLAEEDSPTAEVKDV